MAQWKPTQAGLLSDVIKKTPEIVDGKKATLYVEPFLSSDGNYLNVKIEVEDGNKYLATISDFSGRKMKEVWGGDMLGWVGRIATMEVKESRDYKKYVVFHPTEETNPEHYKPMTPEQLAELNAARDAEKRAREVTQGEVPASDIPF